MNEETKVLRIPIQLIEGKHYLVKFKCWEYVVMECTVCNNVLVLYDTKFNDEDVNPTFCKYYDTFDEFEEIWEL